MEITTTIKFPDQVTRTGKPFRLDIKCPVCGKQMHLLDFNSGCSGYGMYFHFDCDECGADLRIETEDANKRNK